MAEDRPVDDAARLAALLDGDVAALLRAIARTSVETVRLEDGDVAIEIARAPEAVASPGGGVGEATVMHSGPALARPSDEAPAGPVPLKSQSVGFFHRSRVEGGPDLAGDGARIDSGAVVAVVETLGMAGEVISPVAGTLEFSVADGHPVGFGDVVAVIHPA